MKITNDDIVKLAAHHYGISDHEVNKIISTHQSLERLHDEIAIAAMQGMLAHPTRYKPRTNDKHLHWHDAISKEAHELACAMIKNRPSNTQG